MINLTTGLTEMDMQVLQDFVNTSAYKKIKAAVLANLNNVAQDDHKMYVAKVMEAKGAVDAIASLEKLKIPVSQPVTSKLKHNS